MINLLCDILKKYNINFFFDENNFNKLRLYKEFIIDCIKTKYDVCKLLEIYNKILFNNL